MRGFDPEQMSPAMRRQLERKLMEQHPEARAMRDMLTGVKGEKPTKYRAVKTWADGFPFDSRLEADYYQRLKLLVRAGALDGFLFHGKMLLVSGTGPEHRGVAYETDFVLLKPDGTYEIVDTKGVETPEFKQKMKLVRERYPGVTVTLERRGG